jgi:CheY-like chemotaxis protein
MSSRILVVDPNEAFAIMLKEMLEGQGSYDVHVASSGSDALSIIRRENFDLTIVDMDLDPGDMGYRDLIAGVREKYPMMRIMVIPLMGERLPPESHQLNIQGTLSKPFFADDLLPGIKHALASQVQSQARPAPAGPPSPPTPVQPSGDLQAMLSELARETQADVALLMAIPSGKEQILAQSTTLDRAQVEMLANLSISAARAAQAIVPFLGQPDAPFEHNMFENDESRLYLMALPRDLLLLIVTSIHTPLGTIRHNLRRTRRQLEALGLPRH